jgi:tRNA(Ile)-lysidine synthase
VRGLAAGTADTASSRAGAFDRRLDPGSAAPVAVAVSGGGDSLAALILTVDWATRRGRRVLALSVDHGLQVQSHQWIDFTRRAARRLGADFRALSWIAPKPSSGLPAAARAARHRLIAEAAHEAAARVVVFGHTADDVFEAGLMRAEGLRVGTPREWSPSPVWPQGRGLFLLRPLLGMRRAAIRDFLSRRGEAWIEDPANADPGSPRARARLRLAGCGHLAHAPPGDAAVADLARTADLSPLGYIRLDRGRLRQAPPAAARRVLAAAVLSVGGGEHPSRGDRLDRLLAAAFDEAPFKTALAGARIIGETDLLLVRDAGEVARGGLAAIRLQPGAAKVWDGRFEVAGATAETTVHPLSGLASRLDPAERRALRLVPAPARPGLPVLVDGDATPYAPILSASPNVSVRSLAPARFLAACGAISKEPAT